jgi:hypothetical protein
VSARRTPHVHAIALEVEHRVVAAKAADELPETPKRLGRKSIRTLPGDFCGRRELLGIIGHHCRSPFLPPDMTRLAARPFPSFLPQEYQEMCHGNRCERIS